MGGFEPTETEMVKMNIGLLANEMYTDEDRECLLAIMPEIVTTMQRINKKDDSLVYDCLFHAVCLKRLAMLRAR